MAYDISVMGPLNASINGMFNALKEDIFAQAGVQVIKNHTLDTDEVLEATVIFDDAWTGGTIIRDPDPAVLSSLLIVLQNNNGVSFSSLGEDLAGRTIQINDGEYAKITSHDTTQVDQVLDFIVISGKFYNIESVEEIIKASIGNSDKIYMEVTQGSLPKNSPFQRRHIKGYNLLVHLIITSKEDDDKSKLYTYTDVIHELFYGKYNRYIPLIDDDGYQFGHACGHSSEISVKDVYEKTDNALVRCITLPARIDVDYYTGYKCKI